MMAYAQNFTVNRSGLHPSLRGMRRTLGSLGANPTLTAEAAMQQAIQAYQPYHLNSRDFQNAGWLQEAETQVGAGQFNVGWYSASCAGQSAQPLNLFQTASGLALGTTAATVGFLATPSIAVIPAAAVPVVGWVVAGVGAAIGLINAIFAHHAAAVKRDLSFGCSALPAVNNAFDVIAQAVQSGQMKPTDAAAALPQIYENFMQAGGASGSASGPGSIPGGGTAINDSPYCNSNCEMSVILFAMVLYWQAQYQGIAAQQASEAAQAAAVSSPTGVPTLTPAPSEPATAVISPAFPKFPAWAWLAIAAFGAWAVL